VTTLERTRGMVWWGVCSLLI